MLSFLTATTSRSPISAAQQQSIQGNQLLTERTDRLAPELRKVEQAFNIASRDLARSQNSSEAQQKFVDTAKGLLEKLSELKPLLLSKEDLSGLPKDSPSRVRYNSQATLYGKLASQISALHLETTTKIEVREMFSTVFGEVRDVLKVLKANGSKDNHLKLFSALPACSAKLEEAQKQLKQRLEDGTLSQKDHAKFTRELDSITVRVAQQSLKAAEFLEKQTPVVTSLETGASTSDISVSLPRSSNLGLSTSFFASLYTLLNAVAVSAQDHPDICADPMGRAALTDFGVIQQYLGTPNRTITESFTSMQQACTGFVAPAVAYTGQTLFDYGKAIFDAGLALRSTNQELGLDLIRFGQELQSVASNSLGSAVTFCTELRNNLGQAALGLGYDALTLCIGGGSNSTNPTPTNPTDSSSSGGIGDKIKSYAPYIGAGVGGVILLFLAVKWYRGRGAQQEPAGLQLQAHELVRRPSQQSHSGDTESQHRVSEAQLGSHEPSVSVVVHSTTGDTTASPQSKFEQATLGVLKITHSAELEAAKSKVGHPTSSTDQTAE